MSTVLRYAGTEYKLAEGWDAAKVAAVVKETRLRAIAQGSGTPPMATFELQAGKTAVLLVEPGIPFAVEVPNPNPRPPRVVSFS